MSQLQPRREESSSSSSSWRGNGAMKKKKISAAETGEGGAAGFHGVKTVVEAVAVKNPPRETNHQVEAKSQGGSTPITIGGALEAAAITAGNKPVDRSDAAAIQAAEVRATGRTSFVPGGLAATAQSAAQNNAKLTNDEEKTTLSHVLTDAASKLPRDKPVTRQDAEGVVSAELRNNPDISTHPTGVAASVVAAARLNQKSAAAAADSTEKSKN